VSIGRELLPNGSERAVTVEVRDDHGQRITEVTMTMTDDTVMIKVTRAMASRARCVIRLLTPFREVTFCAI
jgi:hypothetical protein